MRCSRERGCKLNFLRLLWEAKIKPSHYDNSHAFGFREAACLQFEGKLQFKRTYAELSESKASLELNAFPDFSQAVKISAILQNSWTCIWNTSPTCKAVLLLCQ